MRRAGQRNDGASQRHRLIRWGPTEPAHIPVEHSFTMSRDDEYTVIKADLIRLLMILAALVVVLVVLTFVLR
jgi:hypothetical protein